MGVRVLFNHTCTLKVGHGSERAHAQRRQKQKASKANNTRTRTPLPDESLTNIATKLVSV